jgi:hypothetical protein
MNFNNLREIKSAGFTGFKRISELWEDHSCIPKETGVYLVLNTSNSKIDFLEAGSGGWFKGKNPNVSLEELRARYSNSLTVYIGKAGSESNKATLRSRLKQYVDFGKGKAIGHWGGRYIWQLSNAKDLIICWKVVTGINPAEVESALISKFKQQFGVRPFANLKD